MDVVGCMNSNYRLKKLIRRTRRNGTYTSGESDMFGYENFVDDMPTDEHPYP